MSIVKTMPKSKYPLPPERKSNLPWPEFKMKFFAYCKHKRKLARAAAEPIIEEIAIPAEVMREIDSELN